MMCKDFVVTQCIYDFVQYTFYGKRSRAAQWLSAGRMRPACHCLDHAELVNITKL